MKSYGTIERYKARLVAKGFHQIYEIDYDETFIFIVKETIIRYVFSITMTKKIGRSWNLMYPMLSCMDIYLTEDVYMKQTHAFVSFEHLFYVCDLKKSLYGLKHTRRAWFENFSSFVVAYGFIESEVDNSMFL